MKLIECKRCRGQVVIVYGGLSCLQCGHAPERDRHNPRDFVWSRQGDLYSGGASTQTVVKRRGIPLT